MATLKSRSPWRQEAESLIRVTLAVLHEGATLQQKRAALRQAYPWGTRHYWPYRVWCQCCREALDPALAVASRDTVRLGPLPDPEPTGHCVLDGLLLALARQPDDHLCLYAVADLLEEEGDDRAATIRALQPTAEDVARRLWPGCTFEAESLMTGPVREYVVLRGQGRVANLRQLREQIAGTTLLRDPAVDRAVAVEKAVLAIQEVVGERRAGHTLPAPGPGES